MLLYGFEPRISENAMRPLTIDLPSLENALDRGEVDHYLDLETGSILSVAPDMPRPGAGDKHDVQPERYLHIEPLTNARSLAMRQDFLFSQHDPHAHKVLSHALAGRRPLRTFDYELEKFPDVRGAWLSFQEQQLHEYAVEWLQENGLEPAGAKRVAS